MKPLGTSVYTESRRSKTARKYRSHCSTCKEAIFGDEPATWQSGEGKPLGLSHDRCVAA